MEFDDGRCSNPVDDTELGHSLGRTTKDEKRLLLLEEKMRSRGWSGEFVCS